MSGLTQANGQPRSVACACAHDALAATDIVAVGSLLLLDLLLLDQMMRRRSRWIYARQAIRAHAAQNLYLAARLGNRDQEFQQRPSGRLAHRPDYVTEW